ncbi:ATP-binding cassette domain-containing protein [Phytoactinopolyspora mesophila]|uniref:UvrABC system protein A n=1 Tax=Phytoactinopolyspora mesophila TaxID=2650750 RepID=A0A7K3MCL4_9ACTN|nr:excinuclease ABC subunit UvrA [Phytoactinopolyspora mesophila]NDL61033.1 ATP-binding cassette domain-containing protein [Phytoactinopolyspora mesophila]
MTQAETATEWIRVTGAREHNLADVTVGIPKRQLTVVTGVSGSGKSSLVFDTVAAEAQRQLNETFTAFARGFLPSYGHPDVDMIENLSAAIVVDQHRLGGGSRSTVGTITDIAPLLRLLFSRAGEPYVGYSNEFSFNKPEGMCPDCEGLGEIVDIDMETFIDPAKSLNDGGLLAPLFKVDTWVWQIYVSSGRFDPDKQIGEYTDDERHALLEATEGSVPIGDDGQQMNASYEGAAAKFRRLYIQRDAAEMAERTRRMAAEFTTSVTCPACHGARLKPAALACRVSGYGIAELSSMEAAELVKVLAGLNIENVAPVVDALTHRVQHLVDIGLGYLSLDRPTGTLSGGESQRIKLVRHLASTLTDMLYVFDEPSVGLHARDVHRLTDLLMKLRDNGNTVLVVEHDRDVIAAADHVIDIGPGAGADGGHVVFTGTVDELKAAPTLTGRHIEARPTPKPHPRKPTGMLPVTNARVHNLQNVSLELPTGVLTAVTGVAGSGKSSLIHGVFCVQHPGAVVVDQSAPTANRRSNTATYTGALDPIRRAFARANGVSPSLFSANSTGACETCQGAGVIYTDLAFLEGVTSTCDSCHGRRFTDEVLAYHLDGATISDVLEMPVAEALKFFAGQRKVQPILQAVVDVGLDYLRLGQPLTSLSGGECQRIKLATELHREGAVYVLDEPTTGLHLSDIERLLEVLDRLVERGSTVIVIEHDLDVIAHADWIVDLGPDGGSGGGRVVFEGTAAQLLEAPDSHTGEYLRRAVAA